MADSSLNLQLGDYLKKIEETIITKVPSYLEVMGGNLQRNNFKNDRLTYRILDCSVKLVDPLQLAFHAASVMFEAKIHVDYNKSKILHSVMVKAMPFDGIIKVLQNSVDQFFNESKIFSEIVPLLLQNCAKSSYGDKEEASVSCNLSAVYDLFPKCYYVSPDPDNGMIMLQDLRMFGYKIGGDKTMLLDYDHIAMALEGLARFHALSYGMKKKDFERFERHVVSQIRDARRFVRKQAVSDSITVGYAMCMRHTMTLILDKFNETQLKECGLYADKIRRVREKIDNCPELLRELLVPEEPLAVLCHGDFNMNNMLFRYDSNSRPSGVKFFDFQTPFYASPAIDLSFFLFLNGSPELWANGWDDLFSIYHRTLLDALSEFLDCPQEELQPQFSLEAFKEQFSKYCLYGFMLGTCFIMGNSEKSDGVKSFEMFSNGVPSLQEMDVLMKENMKLVNGEVIDRILPLTQELLDKISL
jgi:hypothetical protein